MSVRSRSRRSSPPPVCPKAAATARSQGGQRPQPNTAPDAREQSGLDLAMDLHQRLFGLSRWDRSDLGHVVLATACDARSPRDRQMARPVCRARRRTGERWSPAADHVRLIPASVRCQRRRSAAASRHPARPDPRSGQSAKLWPIMSRRDVGEQQALRSDRTGDRRPYTGRARGRDATEPRLTGPAPRCWLRGRSEHWSGQPARHFGDGSVPNQGEDHAIVAHDSRRPWPDGRARPRRRFRAGLPDRARSPLSCRSRPAARPIP